MLKLMYEVNLKHLICIKDINKKMKILDSRYFYYFTDNKLTAIRKGNWKYIIPITYRVVTNAGKDGKDGKTEPRQQEAALYNLEKDISENKNVINEYPEIAKELKNALEIFDQNLNSHDLKRMRKKLIKMILSKYKKICVKTHLNPIRIKKKK